MTCILLGTMCDPQFLDSWGTTCDPRFFDSWGTACDPQFLGSKGTTCDPQFLGFWDQGGVGEMEHNYSFDPPPKPHCLIIFLRLLLCDELCST